ncbi:hypothetical protein [Streptomyces millisiae]|uniref:Uncharacterized protein n=1 Tax=Streptomyces millisiae TaxID=3075542 RepID=A0ABU2LMC8_9ACTN|nr:hypothetical protein [Streptomyces sp. DSM 44918]MDT0318745.1 hypothetical protein [Streptomyces sp. DSM 44918]
MNIAATRDVEAEAARRNRLASMMQRARAIGSDAGMFGRVPNGAVAAAALNAAITNVTQQVAAGGQVVEDISRSADQAARVGEQSDNEAAKALSRARVGDIGQFNAEVGRQIEVERGIARAQESFPAGGW